MPNYNLKIKTLSPVHIGDGGVYDGMTLLEVNRDFYPVSFDVLVKTFNNHNITVDKFKKWVIDSKGKRFQRKPRINDFITEYFSDKYNAIINTITSHSSYKLDNLCHISPNNDIDTCIKSQLNYPYIPGSELKGAIVTAVIYHFLKDDNDFFKELNAILHKYESFLEQVYESMKKVKELTKQKKKRGYQYFKNLNIPRNDWNKLRRIFSMRERPIDRIENDLKRELHLPQSEVDRIVNNVKEWRKEKQEYNKKIWAEQKRYDKNRIKRITNEIIALEKF